MRVLVTGWPSFRHGEATAGDVLSMHAVHRELTDAGIACEVAWNPAFEPGALSLADADPRRYTDLVFACGSVHGEQIRWLHRRFAHCRRIAVGVSLVDWSDPAVTGFHHVLPRDENGTASVDLSVAAPVASTPVVGVVLAPPQPEYGMRVRHRRVHDRLTGWLAAVDCAAVALDTRLDSREWSRCATPNQLVSTLGRFDVVVSTRLNGLLLGLRAGTPVLAVDPVAGGGKMSAQAAALRWPAIVGAEAVLAGDGANTLMECWRWCRSARARSTARRCAVDARRAGAGTLRRVTRLMRDRHR
jgi:hypothetical protein